MMLRKTFFSDVEIKEDFLRVTISTADRDRDGDIVVPTGAIIENFLKNPVVLFGHNYASLPVGRCRALSISDDKIEADVEFAPADVNPLAPHVENAYRKGFMNSWSIGFIPLEYEPLGEGKGYKYTKWELLEFSAVPVPANPNALTEVRAISKAFDDIVSKLITSIEIKADKLKVCGNRDLPLLDERKWDARAEEKRIREWANGDMKKYAQAFVLVIDGKEDNLTAYKLPFGAVRDGKLYAHRGGVIAAMGAVLGARGGINATEDERKRAYNFLAHYYRRFEMEVPEFHEYSDDELAKLFGYLDHDDYFVLVSRERYFELLDNEEELTCVKNELEKLKNEQDHVDNVVNVDNILSRVESLTEKLEHLTMQLEGAKTQNDTNHEKHSLDEEKLLEALKEGVAQALLELYGKPF